MPLEGCERLANEDGYGEELNNEVLNDLRTLRAANVPGSPFATFGDLTVLDEGQMRSLWNLAE